MAMVPGFRPRVMVKLKSLPSPGALHFQLAPMRFTSRRDMERPSPVPPEAAGHAVVGLGEGLEDGLKTVGSMPMPVSLTEK